MKNKKSKKEKSKRKSKKESKIINPPFSSFKSKGTLASENVIEYHYQRFDNLIKFFDKLNKDKKIKNICIYKNVYESLLEIDINNKNVYPLYTTLDNFKYRLLEKKCIKEKYIPITINSKLPIDKIEIENHTNILLINTKNKQIEFFEPHGYKKKESDSNESVSKYHNKFNILSLFFKDLLPDYKLINVVDYIKKHSFQAKYDSNSGYCVTWSSLFVHYRLLNPNKPIKEIINHMDNYINVNLLLRYARYIEDVLKNKI